MNTNEFLTNYLQSQYEQYMDLYSSPSEPSEPFKFKYQAREILLGILQNQFINEINQYIKDKPEQLLDQQQQQLIIITAVLEELLGENYQETEEPSQSQTHYLKSKDLFSKIKNQELTNSRLHILIFLYNNLGFTYANQEKFDLALELLEQSLSLYQQAKTILNQLKFSITNHSQELTKNALELGSEDSKQLNQLQTNFSETDKSMEKQKEPINLKLQFQPFYLGGIDSIKLIQAHQYTYFYLAQVHMKLGNKPKAAEYSGLTICLQLQLKDARVDQPFDFKDFVNNCLGLSGYYLSESKFLQSILILKKAETIVFDKKDEIGGIWLMMGQVYKELFSFNNQAIQEKNGVNLQNLEVQCNNLQINIGFKDLTPQKLFLYDSYEKSKIYFQESLQLYQMSLQVFPLEGCVTDHCETQRQISSLYGQAVKNEKDFKRIEAIHLRREGIIEPLVNQVSFKFYQNLAFNLLNDLSEIKSDLFDIYCKRFFDSRKLKANKLNAKGKEAIALYDQILRILSEDKQSHVQSQVNLLYSKARTMSKLFYEKKELERQKLVDTLTCYKYIEELLDSKKAKEEIEKESLEKQIEMCKEFCQMISLRIDQIEV